MRSWAADSYDEIRERRAQIIAEEQPKCPLHSSRLLFSCLRSASPCTDACPNRADYIGPQPEDA